MANDVFGVQYLTGNDVYFLIRDREGNVADVAVDSAFEAYDTADLGDYDIAATEQGIASGYYAATLPSWIPPGLYHFNAFDRAGGSPAEGDSIVGFGTIEILNEDLATPEIYPDGVERATAANLATVNTKLPAALVGGLMSSDVTAVATSTQAATNLKQSSLALATGTVVADGSNTATTFKIDTTLGAKAADYFGNDSGGMVLAFVDGATNEWQTRRVIDFNTTTDFITVEEAFDATVAGDDEFILIGRITELS